MIDNKLENISVPQAHKATAFHFLISKRLGFFVEEEGAATVDPSSAGVISTSVDISEKSIKEEGKSKILGLLIQLLIRGSNIGGWSYSVNMFTGKFVLKL